MYPNFSKVPVAILLGHYLRLPTHGYIPTSLASLPQLLLEVDANVTDALEDIKRMVGNIAAKRDERKDGFYKVVKNAMKQSLGKDAEEAFKALTKQGFARPLIKQALELAGQQERFTVFSMVDALTRLSGQLPYAGHRTEADIHCHLDLYPEHAAMVHSCESGRIFTLAVTTTPKAWPRNQSTMAQLRIDRAILPVLISVS